MIQEEINYRIENLKSFNLVDSQSDSDFDNLTKMTSHILNTPISLIVLVDRNINYFKSRVGIDAEYALREGSFCEYAIKNDGPFIVNNAYLDERFNHLDVVKNNPSICFYAGIPLFSKEGYVLGTLCVMDYKERAILDEEVEILKMMAKQVENLMELRRLEAKERFNEDRARKYNKSFCKEISHELSNPISIIENFSYILKNMDKKDGTCLDGIDQGCVKLKKIVNRLKKYSKL